MITAPDKYDDQGQGERQDEDKSENDYEDTDHHAASK